MIAGLWMICIGLAAAIAGGRGYLWTGVALGFFLGPLGVLVAMVIPSHGAGIDSRGADGIG